MGAPQGNTNALGNNGGRPPIYNASSQEDLDKVSVLCEEYFQYIKGESKEDEFEFESEPDKFETRKTIVRNPEPPTITGLTLFLGFDNKSTLYDYAKKVEFSNPIKRAITKIEQFHEIAAAYGDKCVGNIFILKNFGWADVVEQKHSGSIDSRPRIAFVKKENE